MPIEGHETVVTIPEGTVVTPEADVTHAEGNTEVVVDLGDDQKAVMFAVDVRQRGEEIKTHKAAS